MPTNERKRKLLDLEELRREIPHVSQSGLSATIKALKRRGLPDLDNRQDFQEARDLWAAGLNTLQNRFAIRIAGDKCYR